MYIVYYSVYCDYFDVLIGHCLSELLPIAMYGLRLFIVVLQELHCLPKCLHICMVRVRGCYHFVALDLLVSEIATCKCIA